MAGLRFPGGLKLDPRRSPRPDAGTLRTLPPPARLIVPMLQHQGQPARPCVGIGARVRKGERIGAALGEFSANVHAPCAGHVVAIGEREAGHPSGHAIACVEIEPDGGDDRHDLPRLHDWHTLDRAGIARRLHEAGVVGLGGATFPTALKLGDDTPPVEVLIVNGVESDPYAASDDALLRDRADDVVAGALLLAHALSARRAVIAVNDVMHEAMAALRMACAANADAHHIEVTSVPARYPQGGERQLAFALTGIETAHDTLPRDRGVVGINVATAAAAWRAVAHGEALVSRIVTVAGAGVRQPCVLDVPLGTPIADLVAAAGGYGDDARRLVLGGAMMGQALPHDDIPIGKADFSVLVLSSAELPDTGEEMPCIRCGECARVCPSRLPPQRLVADIRAGQFEHAATTGLHECIECGLCDTVCPSHIPLLHWLRHGKGELAFAARERALADRSRQAHHARNERMAQLAEERERRLAARERAPASAAMPAVLAAALAKARAGKPAADDESTS